MEPRPFRTAAAALVCHPRPVAGHPRPEHRSGRCRRHAADTHRGNAGLQRGRRVRAVPWNHPRLSGEVARAHRWRSRRRSSHPRPQHCADWHARTGRRVAGMVQHPSCLRLARRAHARDRGIRLCVDALCRWQVSGAGGGVACAANAEVPRSDRCISDGVCGVVADLSRKLQRARARGLHSPCSRSDSERGGDHRLRRCQRAMDSARWLPRDAGVHCNATGASVRRRGTLRIRPHGAGWPWVCSQHLRSSSLSASRAF